MATRKPTGKQIYKGQERIHKAREQQKQLLRRAGKLKK